MNTNKHIALIMYLALLMISCTDQRDLFVASRPMLLIKNEWNPARIDTEDEGATLMIYPRDNQTVLLDDPSRKILEIEEGAYDMLLFNSQMYSEAEPNLDNICYKNTKDFYRFEACANEMAPVRRFRTKAGEVVIENPDTLATRSTASLALHDNTKFQMKYKNGENGFITTPNYIADSVMFVPCRVVHVCHIIAHVVNAKALNGRGIVKGSLRGFAGSCFIAQRLPSHTNVTHQGNLNHLQFDAGSTSDGVISLSFSTFGPPLDLPSRTYELDLDVRYPSGSEIHLPFDVTEQLKPQIERLNAQRLAHTPILDDIIIRIELELGPDPGPGDNWDVGLEEWGDDIIVSVPIKP